MLPSIHVPPRLAMAREAAPRTTLTQRLTLLLWRCWQAECKRAKRPDRIVPYY